MNARVEPAFPRLRSILGTALGFLLLAMAIAWPLPMAMDQALPLGTEPAASVPLLNLWTLWWNAESLPKLYQGYWQAPIFHPLEGTFAFSEPQPLTGLLSAPFFWLGLPPALGYNTFLLLALTANGLLTWLLLRLLGLGTLSAYAGGAWMLALPFVWQELGVLQLVPLGGILSTLIVLLLFSYQPSLGRGLALGLAFASTYLLCGYYGLFLALLLALAGPILILPQLRAADTWKGLGAAGLAATLLLTPMVLAQLRTGEEHQLSRSRKVVERHAAKPVQYLQAAWPQRLPLVPQADDAGARAFFPGGIEVGLALLGLAWGLAGRRRHRQWTIFCATLCAGAFLLSLGPRLNLWGFQPYELLATWVPGYAQVRSLFRFALFVQLAIMLLASLGLAALLIFAQTRRHSLARGLLRALALLLALGALVDMWPTPARLQTLPALDSPMPWLQWVEKETRQDAVLAFLPMASGGSSKAYETTAQWMFWQMRHGRPMVGGYSGYFPASTRELKDRAAAFPSGASLDAFAERGVDYFIVLRAYMEERPPIPTTALKLLFRDQSNGVEIYAPDRRRPPPTAREE